MYYYLFFLVVNKKKLSNNKNIKKINFITVDIFFSKYI